MPTCSNSGRLTLGFPWTLVRTSHPILVNLDSCDLKRAPGYLGNSVGDANPMERPQFECSEN